MAKTAKDDQTPKKGKTATFVKGMIQLALVIGFVIGAVVVSEMLKIKKQVPGEKTTEARLTVAETSTISPQNYTVEFTTTGSVTARADVSVIPQVGGKVSYIYRDFFDGGLIPESEPFFTIESIDYELAVDQLTAALEQAEAAYTLEKAESESAIKGWKQINPDKPVPSLVARKPQLLTAEANVNAAKAQLEDAKLDLERTEVSLPFTARVMSTSLDEGQIVTAGQSVGTVYNIDTLEVEASLNDRELSWLMNQNLARIKVISDYLGKKTIYDGRLKRGVSDVNTQTRFARVNIGFTEPPADLVPGVFVDVNITGPTHANVYVIPLSAVQKDGTVWHVQDNNTVSALKGTMLFENNEHVVMRLAARDYFNAPVNVVTSKLPGAAEGVEIKPLSSLDNNTTDEGSSDGQ